MNRHLDSRDLVERGLPPTIIGITPTGRTYAHTYRDNWDRTYLHLACLVGSRAAVTLLGAGNVHTLDEDSLSPADCAVVCSHTGALIALDAQGVTPKGYRIAQWRLRAALDPMGAYGGVPPERILSLDDEEMSRWAPHWDCRDDDDWTLAERGLCVPIVINAHYFNQSGVYGKTPLFYACTMGHADAAVLLLVMGSSAVFTDNSGWTALHYALQNNHTLCAEAVVKFGGVSLDEWQRIIAEDLHRDLIRDRGDPQDRDLLIKLAEVTYQDRPCDAAIREASVKSERREACVQLIAVISPHYGRPRDAMAIARTLNILPWCTEHHHWLMPRDRRSMVFLLYALKHVMCDDEAVCTMAWHEFRARPREEGDSEDGGEEIPADEYYAGSDSD